MWFADLDTTCVWYRCEEDEIPNPARCASLGQKGDDTLPGGKPFNSLYTKAADFNWSRKGSCESKRANFCEPSSEDKALEQRKQARTPAGFCQLWPDAVYKPGVDGRFPRDQFDLGNGYFPRKDIDEDATLATMEADEIPCMNNPELKTVATLRSELPAKLAHLREVAQKEAAAREARERVEAAAREQRELKALAGMVTPWSKAQCIRAINNFIRNGGIVFSVRAATLWIASENLGRCENYAWTFEERNQLALPIPFKQVEDSEQNVLAQALNAKIVDFIRQKNLTEKFAWEVGHNSIVASDSIGFLRRNGLEQEFNRNDDLKFQKMDAPGRMNETHATALLLGVVTQ